MTTQTETKPTKAQLAKRFTKDQLIDKLDERDAEFAAFREQVIDEVRNHPQGCEEGKEEFLQELGLVQEPEPLSFTVTLKVETGAKDVDGEEVDPEAVARAIVRDLKDGDQFYAYTSEGATIEIA
jgi:hypothetical protein